MEKQDYHYWFVTFWCALESGGWGMVNCVYRQISDVLNIKLLEEHYTYSYSLNFPGDSARFVVTSYKPITYEEFCLNGTIAYTNPDDIEAIEKAKGN